MQRLQKYFTRRLRLGAGFYEPSSGLSSSVLLYSILCCSIMLSSILLYYIILYYIILYRFFSSPLGSPWSTGPKLRQLRLLNMYIYIYVYIYIYIYIYIMRVICLSLSLYIYIYIYMVHRLLLLRMLQRVGCDIHTPSPPIKSLDFRGFDSSRLLILRGGNSHVR